MDDLLALMNDGDEGESQITSNVVESSSNETKDNPGMTTEDEISRNGANVSNMYRQEQAHTDSKVDDTVGIRMVNRLISSIDLLDMISLNLYHTPASLCAMSRASLNSLLEEPAMVLDAATVCGKTKLMTVGIVFTNSGTRISSNGRAFAIFTVGNLNTGPIVTLFLFGNAYSHCTKCPPGTVVALLMPKIVPPKENEKSQTTCISLSVDEERQLVRVGAARDFARCKATVRSKRTDGKWVSNGAQCKNFVDRRRGDYCQTHKNQQVRNDGARATVKWKGPTTFQQLKSDHVAARTAGSVRSGFTANTKKQLAGALTVLTPPGPSSAQVPNGPCPLIQSSAASGSCEPNKLRAPLHMKQKPHRKDQILYQHPVSHRTNKGLSQPRNAKCKHPNSEISSIDWLKSSKKRAAVVKNNGAFVKKRRNLNVDMASYSGSVPIPKPNKLFSSTARKDHVLSAKNDRPPASRQPCVSDILKRQKEMAIAFRNHRAQSSTGRTKVPRARLTGAAREKECSKSLEDSLFGKLGDVDVETMRLAKSRYSNEADAELMAKSMRAVAHLERREERVATSKCSSNNAEGGKVSNQKQSNIQKEWICDTCKRTTLFRPKACLRSQHKVRLNRAVTASVSMADKKHKLQRSKVEEGGLTLGSGLEWRGVRFH